MERVNRTRPAMLPDTPFQRFPLQPSELTERITSSGQLFVLAHMGIPRVDPETWTLEIDGLVDHPMRLSLHELQRRPKRTVEAVHTCCGSPLTPEIPKRRAVNVVWGGVPLDELLDEAGPTRGEFLVVVRVRLRRFSRAP